MGFRDRFSRFMGKKKKAPSSSVSSSKAASALEVVAAEVVVAAVDAPPRTYSLSLWDNAYDQVKARKRDLIEEYEKVLMEQEEALSQLDDRPLERRNQMQSMAEHGLRCIGESRQGSIVETLSGATKLLSSVKSIINAAVKVSPEASAVWAGICLAIPLVENLAESTTAMQEGFVYLASRMEYYAAFEKVFFRSVHSSSPMGLLMEANKPDIIRLYGQIIEYISQCVIQLYRSRAKQVIRDALAWDGWKAKLESIKETEVLVARNAEQTSAANGQDGISTLGTNSTQLVELFQSVLKICSNQLEVAREDREIAERNHEIISQQLNLSKKAEQRAMTKEEQRCIQVFREGQQNYADWKDGAKKSLSGTCKWLFQHENYLKWEAQSSGPVLVSANPGCGKSVLARYLVDEHLPLTAPHAKICYFFFKDQFQNTLQQALCAVIHQLLKTSPALVKHASTKYVKKVSRSP